MTATPAGPELPVDRAKIVSSVDVVDVAGPSLSMLVPAAKRRGVGVGVGGGVVTGFSRNDGVVVEAAVMDLVVVTVVAAGGSRVVVVVAAVRNRSAGRSAPVLSAAVARRPPEYGAVPWPRRGPTIAEECGTRWFRDRWSRQRDGDAARRIVLATVVDVAVVIVVVVAGDRCCCALLL